MSPYKILSWLSVLVLIFISGELIYFVFFVDVIIPEHFNFLGEASGSDTGGSIYRLVFLSFCIFLGLNFLSRRVHILNYPVYVNDSNRIFLYRQMKLLLRCLQLACLLIISGIILGKLIYPLLNINIFGLYYLICSLIILFCPLFFFIFRMLSAGKQ